MVQGSFFAHGALYFSTRSMNILGIVLLLFQVQLGSLSGIVTKPGGTEPLSGATLTLSPAASSQALLPLGVTLGPGAPTQNPRVRTVTSQDDGRFVFADIEPGEYRLQVQSARFGSAAYGQRRPNGPGGAILTVRAGQRLSDLKIAMVPTGTIAGRITGRSGEPIVNASVQAMKYIYQEGKRVFSVAQMTTTDDRGEYRLFWLTSGKYIVVATPRFSSVNMGMPNPVKPGEGGRADSIILTVAPLGLVPDVLLDGSNLVKRILDDGTVQEESGTPMYYPATIDPTQAATVEVNVGATVPGIDITLGPSPVQKIRGRVTGLPAGSQATVSLSYGAQALLGRLINKGASTIDGSFEFAGIVPGLYYLAAQDRTGLASTPVAVLVGSRDVENISLALSPSMPVFVRFTTEGIAPGTPDPLSGLTGTLRADLDTPFGIGNLPTKTAVLPSGGPMIFTNVAPGDYQFNIGQSARENQKRLYIKSVRLGREDAFSKVRISSDTQNPTLDVVLTAATGSIDGAALARTGDPAANVTVALIPANARKRSALYQAIVTGSDGKFAFKEIPPGDYKLFAWEDVETGAWENAEFIGLYESRGHAVRVSEDSKENVQLNVIYNP